MKKFKFLSLVAASCALAFAACNNDSDTTAGSDSTGTTPMVSTNQYAARADSFRSNTASGYYLNPRTGKAYKGLMLDTSTGMLTDDMNMPVKRYVDNRNWHVYDATGQDIGTSRMDKDMLMYDMEGQWVPYNKRWTDDTSSTNMNDNGNMNNNNNGNMMNHSTGDDQMDSSTNRNPR